MKKALIIGGVCVGLLLACIIGMAITPPRAQTPTATQEPTHTPIAEPTKTQAPAPTRAVGGVDPEDLAFTTCWLDEVMGPWGDMVASIEAVSWAAESGDLVATNAQALLLESDIRVTKMALLACPLPKHPLLVSTRAKALRGIDLVALACQYLVEGIATLDGNLIAKGYDPMMEAGELFQEIIRDMGRYQAEILGE